MAKKVSRLFVVDWRATRVLFAIRGSKQFVVRKPVNVSKYEMCNVKKSMFDVAKLCFVFFFFFFTVVRL